jgi:hypothetical protein
VFEGWGLRLYYGYVPEFSRSTRARDRHERPSHRCWVHHLSSSV